MKGFALGLDLKPPEVGSERQLGNRVLLNLQATDNFGIMRVCMGKEHGSNTCLCHYR